MSGKRPLNIAHRGARAYAPENTLAAARLAHEAGADMWELDTCLSKDGHLVVIHDDTLERTTDVARRIEFRSRAPWRVDGFTLEELRTLDAGTWFVEEDPFGTVASSEIPAAILSGYRGEKIPTLEEALVLTRQLDWRVNVEIKNHFGATGHNKVAAKVAELVDSLGMKERVVFSSFQHSYLRELARLLPDVPRGALVERPSDEAAQEEARLAGLAVTPAITAREAVSLCQASDAAYFHPDKAFLTSAGMVDEIQGNGYGINVWTVNTPEDMVRMVKYGVHGIITDYPARLHQLL